MKNIDSYNHVRGESIYVDDITEVDSTLFAHVYTSQVAHGKIVNLDLTTALEVEGVEAIFTADDIPGENQIGRVIQDEGLLAEEEVHFIGHPIAIIVAQSKAIAKHAEKKISIEFEEKDVITDPREAYTKGEIIGSPRTFELGNIEEAWKECDVILSDTVEISGQEHIYLETQGAYALPVEKEGLLIYSSTQGPTAVQQTIARILDIPMNKVEVDVRRLGGAFGGKEDQATPYAAMAGLAAYILKKPVKLILDRDEDIKITGKRHPYSVDYKIGLTKDGKIQAYQAMFYQNAGAAADLSTAVLERTLFHVTNSYFVPNVEVTAASCRTNLPPNTAFRGFGGPQGMFVIEAAIFKAAHQMGYKPWEIQKLNLLSEEDVFPYGQSAEDIHIRHVWNRLEEIYDLENIESEIEEFNQNNELKKKGLALMPICFGIAFTATFMNQASALVHVYLDGSVGVSTAAVEMGQGVNTRIAQVPQRVFSLPPEKIKIETTNTTRVANTSPSAASSTHDLNGKATQKACMIILDRLKELAIQILEKDDASKVEIIDQQVYYDGIEQDLTWNDLAKAAFFNRVDLSQHAYYATPDIYFDLGKEKGKPFAYHAYGVGIIETTVDCLRGTYEIDSVKVVHDFGESMNPIIDLGQAEGGLVQGIGFLTSEELRYNEKGELESNSLSTYKIPDIYAAPKEIKVHFLEDSENELGLFKSKAIGEPPLMYGIGAFFSLENAIRAFNPDTSMVTKTPMTPERVLLGLYDDLEDKRDKESQKAESYVKAD